MTTTPLSSAALPPVIVDTATLDGTTVDVRLGNTVDINGGDGVTDWQAEITDPQIVVFTPGRTDGSATFNPGLDTKAAGTTEVTLTNTSTKQVVNFTVKVS